MRAPVISLFFFLLWQSRVNAQAVHECTDSLVVSGSKVTVVINSATGKVGYRFSGGASISNTVAYMEDLNGEYIYSADFSQHPFSTVSVQDGFGTGIRINLQHTDAVHRFVLLQRITLYGDQPYVLLDVQAISKGGNNFPVETRNISPLAVLPSRNGSLFVPGNEPRILDMPFDNDDWVGVVERKWGVDPSQKGAGAATVSGISYEVSSVYDNATLSGLVIGSLSHDFWKTGIACRAAADKGLVDSFTVFGGVATPDDPSPPHAYGGQDGTHHHMPHGTKRSASVQSPVIYLSGSNDMRADFTGYGEANAQLNGRLSWKGYAPVYWNSFGVQGTLWPYTNLDVCVMKNFQKNPDLSEQEIKVRIYAMMAMGSILGDGSDFRQPLAAERAKKFLDNPSVCAFFSHPRAFTPLQFADGDSFDQQLAFYLKADNPGINPITGNAFVSIDSGKGAPLHPTLLALFNFSNKGTFSKSFKLETMGLPKNKYILKDFMTDTVLGTIEKGQDSFSLTVPEKDAYMVKIIQIR